MATGEAGPLRDLPEGFDPGLLVGLRLEHVTFAEFTLHFVFDGRDAHDAVGGDTGVVICACHDVEHSHLGSVAERTSVGGGPIASSRLMRLCGRTVASVAADTLRITFDDGQALAFIPAWDGYEEYVIDVGGKTFVMGPRRDPS